MAVVHPDLSAVIPTFNRELLIGRAIESVLDQSVRPSEIIVVDDGSTDSTKDIVAGYGDVRYVAQTNAGPAVARNRGVAEASTSWIAWLDSDDFWLPGHIERIMSAVDATSGGARFYFADVLRPVDGVPTSHWSRCDFGIEGQFELVDDAADWVLLPRRPVMMQASVIHRDAYESVGGIWQRLRMNEDGHLFIRLGVGHSACAVAGLGAEMTDDAPVEDRLFGGGSQRQTRAYKEELVAMYGQLLEDRGRAGERHISLYRRRLKGAHLALARLDARDRCWRSAIGHVGSAAVADPQGFVRSATSNVRRRLGRPS